MRSLDESSLNIRLFPPPEQLAWIWEESDTVNISISDLTKQLHELSDKCPHGARPWIGWKLDPLDQLAHLAALYRSATNSDYKGLWTRADFYWQEIFNTLGRIWSQEDFWKNAETVFSKNINLNPSLTPLDFRNAVVRELFVDTLCGLYNGRITRAVVSRNDRAFQYIDWIERFAPLLDLSEVERQSLFYGPYRQRIKLNSECKKWKAAISDCEKALHDFPDSVEFQNIYSEILFSKTFDELTNGDSKAQYESDADALKAGINRLEETRKLYPGVANIYQYLGIIHHARAVKLGNANQFAEALLEVEKAGMFAPDFDQVPKTRDQLLKVLSNLQDQMIKFIKELARTPNATLNAEGQKLRKEAENGNALRYKFLKSEEPNKISQGLQRAQAETLWNRIGLAKPKDDSGSTALALMKTLQSVVDSSPSSIDELHQLWEKNLQTSSIQESIDKDRVIDFLARHVFGIETCPEGTKLNSEDDERNPYFSFRSTTEPPPILDTEIEHNKVDREPFKEWLLSRQSLRLKVQCVVSIILLLAVGGMWSFDSWTKSVRASAYSDAISAEAQTDPYRILEASEKFFSQTPFANDTEREMLMRDVYSRALVHWVLQNDDVPTSPNTLERFGHYRKINKE